MAVRWCSIRFPLAVLGSERQLRRHCWMSMESLMQQDSGSAMQLRPEIIFAAMERVFYPVRFLQAISPAQCRLRMAARGRRQYSRKEALSMPVEVECIRKIMLISFGMQRTIGLGLGRRRRRIISMSYPRITRTRSSIWLRVEQDFPSSSSIRSVMPLDRRSRDLAAGGPLLLRALPSVGTDSLHSPPMAM